jgi:hypothetical protein
MSNDKDQAWARITRIDAAISLAAAGTPAMTGFFEGIPWTYRIPAMALSACAVLYLWRHLTLRRLLMPTALQKHYENDLISLDELYRGRSRISDITFRNVEFRGPGALYIHGDCRMKDPLYSPHRDTLIIMPQNNASLLPFYAMRNCVLDGCMFTSLGLLVDINNYRLFGLPDPPAPELPMVMPRQSSENLDKIAPPQRDEGNAQETSGKTEA